ncbi:hypothetical protein [Mycobacterium sp. SMC-4]|uniref:hypothetical protein n=1 Tax=Mycobacterium sp. SMC-4 TaxID=2857059 RepID=UPI0021B3950C|nr:hypothetical protein [Mycobacterium sp. SMC-4]UXA18820.1 hypothetical protein KXD98_03790 [Mycobacterium sp. SMC-4]
MGERRSESGGGFVAAFIFLVLFGVVIQYIWWILGAVALTGLLSWLFVWLRRQDELRDAAAERDRRRELDLRIRADRQHRWSLIGDSRGTYGPDGAAVMRRVTEDDPVDQDEDDDEDRPIATITRTGSGLTALRTQRPQQWHWALFTSILLQRREALAARLRDSALGFVPATTTRIYSGSELADRVYSLVDDMWAILHQVMAFMAAPDFMRALGQRGPDPDADAIEHVAGRLMDYHVRLLELSEQCRALSAPSAHSDVLRDCARVLHEPLEAYRVFIDELVELVDAFPRILSHANGTIDLGAIALDVKSDEALLDRLKARCNEISPP